MRMLKAARKNMVLSQLQTNGIVEDALVEAYLNCPREMFVDPAAKPVIYADTSVQTAFGMVLEPLVEARMVKALGITASDRVVVVGAAAAPTAALCAGLAESVVLVSTHAAAVEAANTAFQAAGLLNVRASLVANETEIPANTACLFAGALPCAPSLPQGWMRAVYVLNNTIILAERLDTGVVQTTSIAQATAAPLAENFIPTLKSGFVF